MITEVEQIPNIKTLEVKKKTSSGQIIYISLDDSGKLNKNEKFLVYGGLYFTDKKELEKFKMKYKNIRNDISKKDKYKNIDELKGFTLANNDRLRLLKFINKYHTLALIIDNTKIEKEEILISKNARGRYRDFAIKLLIKQVFIELISNEIIDPYKPITLVLNIDQESSKTNGKYNLDEGIVEELTKGIINFNYGFKTTPILFSKFEVHLYSQNSKDSIIIQASDLVANNVWRNLMTNKPIDLVNVIKRLP